MRVTIDDPACRGAARRLIIYLKTSDVEVARRRRDRVLAALQEARVLAKIETRNRRRNP